MDASTRQAIEAIERVCENPSPPGPVEVAPEYLRAIERIEGLPCNQSGADKSWVRKLLEATYREWREAKPVDPMA